MNNHSEAVAMSAAPPVDLVADAVRDGALTYLRVAGATQARRLQPVLADYAETTNVQAVRAVLLQMAAAGELRHTADDVFALASTEVDGTGAEQRG